MFSGMMSGGGQNSGGCKFSRAPGCALPHSIVWSLCLRCFGNCQVECEVIPTVLEHGPTLGRARPGRWWGQDKRTLTFEPSKQDLPTGSTSWKRPKSEEGQGRGWGLGGWDQQLRLGHPAHYGPHLLGGTFARGPSDPWGLSQ